MSTAAATRLAAARLRAAADRPYYATALFALEPVRTDDGGPVTVDAAGRLLWNDTIDEEPVNVTATRIIHGLEHLLRDHAGRGIEWIQRIGVNAWARACDCEIDDDLGDLARPVDLLTATALGLPEGRAAEWYAARFVVAEQSEPEQPDPESSSSSSGGDPGGDPAEALADRCGGPVCGCPATSSITPTEAPGLSEVRIEQLRTQVAEAIAGHRGDVPTGIARWAADRDRPRPVEWRALLLRHVRRATRRTIGGDDHCSRRPSRRSPHPILLPRLRGRQIHPAVVLDTSGSISDTDLADARDAVTDLLRTVSTGEGVTVVACDSEVHASRTVRRASHVPLVGGGGSDMTPGIEAAVASGADVVVVLTDGFVTWPRQPLRIPVIVGILGGHTDTLLPPNIPTVAIGGDR